MDVCNAMSYTRLVIRSFRSKGLARFWTRSDARGLRPDWVGRIDRQLAALDQAVQPKDLDVVTFGFHPLTGDQAGRFAITVSRNWRLTFGFEGQDVVDVDLEDYHGR